MRILKKNIKENVWPSAYETSTPFTTTLWEKKQLDPSGLQIYNSSEKQNNLDFCTWSFLFYSPGKPRIFCLECKNFVLNWQGI